MKVWIFEDRDAKIRNIESVLLAGHVGSLTFRSLQTVEAGDRALQEIDHGDVVFLDSQVPSEETGLPVNDAGERLAARLRATGCECKIFWHSGTTVATLEGLGVVNLNSLPDTVDLAAVVFGAAPLAASKEEWRQNGEVLLAKLTAAAPLAEFATMSVLCQGFLAVVGAAGRFENEVADELRKFEGGRQCLEEARGHLVEALDTAKWFEGGRESIAEAVRRRGTSEEDYWRGVVDGLDELEPDVAAVRALYERLRRARVGEAGDASEWHVLVVGAHSGLQRLLARRYL